MCGISGVLDLGGREIAGLKQKLNVMNKLLAHRGPDGKGCWAEPEGKVGLAHCRLAIIDLSERGAQPMRAKDSVISFNGEIYNYKEIRSTISSWPFQSQTDTEVILAGYEYNSFEIVHKLRGMFAFALWDSKKQRLFCARDHFGIKPFYYLIQDNIFYFASEAKALIPFIHGIEMNDGALAEYSIFQHPVTEETLFKGIKQLLPGHHIIIENGNIKITQYWDVTYRIDTFHPKQYFDQRLCELVNESIDLHLRSDVPIGSYLSGGIDSSLIALLAQRHDPKNNKAFHGKFTEYPGYDESFYARLIADQGNLSLFEEIIDENDFVDEIQHIIYMLDYPVGGPGSFPQYMVSKLASSHVKVVLGGQGGDEIFGGYARYIIAYLEQCLKSAIEGNHKDGHFLITLESIIPNLGILREYKPLLKKFWQRGLFGEMSQRYLHLIDRSADSGGELVVDELNVKKVKNIFSTFFNEEGKTEKKAYFDRMTRFDFKKLLPALLHIEDRMSMAHGLESRVPFLYSPLIEFMATIPPRHKFPGGKMKHLLKENFADILPPELLARRDKMGFPVPLKEWFDGPLKTFVQDTFRSQKARNRSFINSSKILERLEQYEAVNPFSRNMWGALSLEIWQQNYHDQHKKFKSMVLNSDDAVC